MLVVIAVVQRNDMQLAMKGNIKIYKITFEMNLKGFQKVRKEHSGFRGLRVFLILMSLFI